MTSHYDNLVNLTEKDLQRMIDQRSLRSKSNRGNIFYDNQRPRRQEDHLPKKDAQSVQSEKRNEDHFKRTGNPATEYSLRNAVTNRTPCEDENFNAGSSSFGNRANHEKSFDPSSNGRKYHPNVNTVGQRLRGCGAKMNREKSFDQGSYDRRFYPSGSTVEQRPRGSELCDPAKRDSDYHKSINSSHSRDSEYHRPANPSHPRDNQDRRPVNSVYSRDNEVRSGGSDVARPSVKPVNRERLNGSDLRQSHNASKMNRETTTSNFSKDAMNKQWKPTRPAGYLNVKVTWPFSKSEYIVVDMADLVVLREIDQSPKKQLTSRPVLNEKYLCIYQDDYYRVKITNLQPLMAFFLDYGTEERIDIKDLFELSQKWREINPLAFEIVISPEPKVQFQEHTKLKIRKRTDNTWEIVQPKPVQTSTERIQRSQNEVPRRSNDSTSSTRMAQPAVGMKAGRYSNETAVKGAKPQIPILEAEPMTTNEEIESVTSIEETLSETVTDESQLGIPIPEAELYNLIEETESETTNDEIEQKSQIEEIELETPIEETKSETANDETELESPIEVSKPETPIEETEVKTVNDETESETPIKETKPETTNDETKLESSIEVSKAKTTNDETEPETPLEKTELKTTSGEIEPEPTADEILDLTKCSDEVLTGEDESKPITTADGIQVSTIVEEPQMCQDVTLNHENTSEIAEKISQRPTVLKELEESSREAESCENEPESGPASLEEFVECSDVILTCDNESASGSEGTQPLAKVITPQEYSDEALPGGKIEIASAVEEFQECSDEIETSENELESDDKQTQLPRESSNKAPESEETEVSPTGEDFLECSDEIVTGEDKPKFISEEIQCRVIVHEAEPEPVTKACEIQTPTSKEEAQLSRNVIQNRMYKMAPIAENEYVRFEGAELYELSADLQCRLPVASLTQEFSIEQLIADDVALFVPFVRLSKTCVAGIFLPTGIRRTMSSMTKELRSISPDPDCRPKAGDLVTVFYDDAFRGLILNEPTPLCPRYTVFCIDSGHVHASTDAKFAPLPSKFEKIPATSVVCQLKNSSDNFGQRVLKECCEYGGVKCLFRAETISEQGRWSGLMKRAGSNSPFAVELEKFWPPLGDSINPCSVNTGDRVQLLPFEVSNKCVIIPADEDITEQRSEMLDHVNMHASKTALETDPRRFEVVAVEYKACLWRAKVVEQEKELFRVQLMDRVEELMVRRDQMRALPEYLKTISCMATPIRLKNVSVNELGRGNRMRLAEFFDKYYSFELVVEEDNEVTLKFLRDEDYEFEYTKFSTVNEFLDDCLKPYWKQCLEKNMEFATTRIGHVATRADENDWIVGEELPLLVTAVGPDGCLFVINKNGPSWRLFNEREFEDRIQEYARCVTRPYCPTDDELCIAKSANGLWGRALCYESRAGEPLRLQFLDFGRCEDVQHTYIRHMQAEFMDYPMLSIEACVLNAGDNDLEELRNEVCYFRIVNFNPVEMFIEVEIIMDDSDEEASE